MLGGQVALQLGIVGLVPQSCVATIFANAGIAAACLDSATGESTKAATARINHRRRIKPGLVMCPNVTRMSVAEKYRVFIAYQPRIPPVMAAVPASVLMSDAISATSR